MGKKRVLLMADPIDDQVAGVHTVVRQVTHYLSQMSQDQFEFFLFRQKKDPNLSLPQIAFPKIRIPGMSFFRLFVLAPLISRWKKIDAVVAFAHFGPFNLPKRVKRITYIHDLTPILFPRFHVFNGWFLHELFLPRILRNADLIFADSKNTARDILKHYSVPEEKIAVNYLGVSDHFQVKENTALLSKYAIDKPYFLYVGTIEPRKGIHILLEAFELFKKNDLEDHYLLIIGKKGWKMPPIEETIAKHPNKEFIKYLGFVEFQELIAFYTMAKFLILPSRYEGFGLPIVEAMYCGTKSIVAQNSSLEEIGLLCESIFFKTDQANDLANKMKSTNIKISQHIQFTWKAHATQFVKQLQKLF